MAERRNSEIYENERGEFAKIVCPQKERKKKKLPLKFEFYAYMFCGQI